MTVPLGLKSGGTRPLVPLAGGRVPQAPGGYATGTYDDDDDDLKS